MEIFWESSLLLRYKCVKVLRGTISSPSSSTSSHKPLSAIDKPPFSINQEIRPFIYYVPANEVKITNTNDFNTESNAIRARERRGSVGETINSSSFSRLDSLHSAYILVSQIAIRPSTRIEMVSGLDGAEHVELAGARDSKWGLGAQVKMELARAASGPIGEVEFDKRSYVGGLPIGLAYNASASVKVSCTSPYRVL